MTPWRAASLVRVVARAEQIRLRLWLRRLARRGVLAMVASVLLLNLVFLLHVAAVLALSRWLRPVYGAVAVAAADAVVAVGLLRMAISNKPGASERQARTLSADARQGLMAFAAPVVVMAPTLLRWARTAMRRGKGGK